MTFPADLLYTKDHEWVKIEGDTATIGVTAFAQQELGDIVFVEINGIGNPIGKHEIFGTVEAVKTVSDLFLPVAGTIVEVNSALKDTPEVVNQDCYGAGWMVKIKLTGTADTSDLMKAAAYEASLGDH